MSLAKQQLLHGMEHSDASGTKQGGTITYPQLNNVYKCNNRMTLVRQGTLSKLELLDQSDLNKV